MRYIFELESDMIFFYDTQGNKYETRFLYPSNARPLTTNQIKL